MQGGCRFSQSRLRLRVLSALQRSDRSIAAVAHSSFKHFKLAQASILCSLLHRKVLSAVHTAVLSIASCEDCAAAAQRALADSGLFLKSLLIDCFKKLQECSSKCVHCIASCEDCAVQQLKSCYS